jgi:hypothetical protein
MTSLFLIILTLLLALYCVGNKCEAWVFLIIFSVSSFYYGVGGVWYWKSVKSGIFVGADWFDLLDDAALLIAFTQVLVFSCISVVLVGISGFSVKNNIRQIEDNSIYYASIFSFAACVFVYLLGSGIKDDGGSVSDSPILLIVYQFTEFPIALILFLITSNRHKRLGEFMLILYVIFCVLVGFRYRIILILLPLFFGWFIFGSGSLAKRFAVAILFIVSVLVGFSVMTISREKFSGINLEAMQSSSADDVVYGFFADTNILFGLLSAISNFGVTVNFAGLSPVYDIFVQYIPRFIFPEKNLYGHLWDVNYGISMSLESLNSATAMPFFGEYYSMFGWGGYFFGTILYSIMVSACLFYNGAVSKNAVQKLIGASLVAVFFGYYYYSRGSIAQISKGIVFVVIPYFFMVKRSK